MTKVLHLTTSRLFGGVERFLLDLVRHQSADSGLELQFGVFYEGRFTQELEKLGVAWAPLGRPRWSRPWTIWKARRALTRHIAHHGVDVVVSHGGWSHSIAAPVCRRDGLRQVLWQHDASPAGHWIQRLAALHAPDLLIANSQFTLNAAKRTFPGVPSIAIHLPVELAPAETPPDTLRARYATAHDDVVILMAARFDAMKGHDLLLEALVQLKSKKIPAWKMWFAAEAGQPSEQALKARLQAGVVEKGLDDLVRFVGHHTDMPALYAAADIYCQPNLGPDAFGLVFAESMLAHLPIVTSQLGGAAELVDDQCAIWTEVGSATSVAKALESLVREPARRVQMGQNGYDRVKRLCDPKTQVRKLETALAGLKANS